MRRPPRQVSSETSMTHTSAPFVGRATALVIGVICFVSNGSYIDTGSFDGFRKTLANEFASVYRFNLRGNQRTSGETSRREGGKVFGQGSRTPVAVTLLVKNPDATGPCTIRYHDIGDYLTREEKLFTIEEFGSIESIPWQTIEPDASGDWINQRDETFASFVPLGDKKDKSSRPVFETYSLGVVTNRDAWAYNFSRAELVGNMTRMVQFYDQQLGEFASWLSVNGGQRTTETVEEFVDRNPTKISWTHNLKEGLRKSQRVAVRSERAVVGMYRPFCKQWLYFDRQFNERVYQIPKIFPTPELSNIAIHVSAGDARRPFSALITDVIPDSHLHDIGQCFPLYCYEEASAEPGLFADQSPTGGYIRRDAITVDTLASYRQRYGREVSKEDIFYYVYGLLHSPEYRERYAADLKKMIPRLPMAPDVWTFSKAGRELASWHLDYESLEPWPLDGLPPANSKPELLRVEKMRFGGSGRSEDRTTIIFNSHVTLRGIPEEAYDYQVNGRSAIEWLMDRYEVKVDKDSGIHNDPNLWSEDPRYVVDLVARIVRVSVETKRIVRALPPID
jgi:predicted helicase